MKHSKRFWSDLFYVPKYEKVSDKAFLRMMLSSVFGILICGICLAGLTWAWFTSSISSAANTITAADFSVSIIYKNNNDEEINPFNESGKLKSGTYKVTITASGTASTGYCKVELGGKTYYTVPLFTDAQSDTHSVEFTVHASEASTLTITHQWGTCAVAATDETPHIGNQNQAKSENHIVNSIGTPPKSMTTAEASEQSEEGETANAIIDTEQNSIPEASTTQPTATENAESEPSVSETPKQTEESSSDLSTQPTSQEGVSEKGTASEAQSVPDTDMTGGVTDEP